MGLISTLISSGQITSLTTGLSSTYTTTNIVCEEVPNSLGTTISSGGTTTTSAIFNSEFNKEVQEYAKTVQYVESLSMEELNSLDNELAKLEVKISTMEEPNKIYKKV